jgi:hypothetical protein
MDLVTYKAMFRGTEYGVHHYYSLTISLLLEASGFGYLFPKHDIDSTP